MNNVKESSNILKNCDAILVIAGAGMSADSGIFTYRGNDGIWSKNITIGNKNYGYDEISSLEMWKKNPELAWGFKAGFYDLMASKKPHKGYYKLLDFLKETKKNNYFICTSNIDNFFEKSGYDKDKIYEVHGSMNYLQCMDKKCAIRNGIIEMTEKYLPTFTRENFVASHLPSCPNCKNILRPNVSMFGDYDFYGKPYEYARKKMEKWLQNIEKNNQTLVILEIGCGINQHSVRMKDGVMMSGEWKIPKITNLTKTIRVNPNDEQEDNNTIHVNLGALQGINRLID
jgi:NAD-dependent SIR2 family protein deacetylase